MKLDIDIMQLDAIAIIKLLEIENASEYSYLEQQLIEKLRIKCMENVVLTGAIKQLRASFPAAAFSVELYMEGVDR